MMIHIAKLNYSIGNAGLTTTYFTAESEEALQDLIEEKLFQLGQTSCIKIDVSTGTLGPAKIMNKVWTADK